MHEILRQVPAGELVLDLGSQSGSFPPEDCAGRAIRVDLEPTGSTGVPVVRADASCLPFRDTAFAAVISNHSLEHFENLDGALGELSRVLRPQGALFVAVPDANTLTDRLYRWLAKGGGHVNAFRSAPEVIERVSRGSGLRYVGGRVLYTSLSFLHPRNRKRPAPRKLWLLGGANETILRWMSGLFRLVDRIAGTRASIYGWALYFGAVHETISAQAWANVCVGCGSGHAADQLLNSGAVKRACGLLRSYRCPACGTLNFFCRDRDSNEWKQTQDFAATLGAKEGLDHGS